MAIDFPSNPSAGATYSYGGILWTWNSTAWDKTTSGSQGNTGPTGPTGPQGNTGNNGTNGNTGPTGPQGNTGNNGNTGATGQQGEPGQSSNYYNYKVHTATQTPPTGNGEIRYNNATQTSSTTLYVDHINSDGDDIDVFLSLLKQNDNLIIQDANNSDNYQTWKITSAPTVILNDYTTIPVTGITSAGTGTSGFANNDSVLFIVFSSPIATQYVESLRGLTGAIGLTNGNGIGLSVSGNTLTVSNSGVLSFNGLTGAVTGVTTGTANNFVALQSFSSGISAAGGVTFAGTLQGTTANFTGLVSSTVGFSGAATNLTGNASGLTVGSASKVQIAQASASSYYFALASGIGNTGLYVDTNTPQWSYFPSSGLLSTSSGAVSADYFQATGVGVYSNNYSAYDLNSLLIINTPNFDGTSQVIAIGDYNGAGNGVLLSIDDATNTITSTAENFVTSNINIAGSKELRLLGSGFTYVGFKAPTTITANKIWTLPSADGSLNQVLTTNGSGTLSWTTPSGSGSYVTSFNGLTGAVQGVSAAVAGSGISVSGATGSVTITNTGVTGIRGGTGISVSSTTGYPTIGVTLTSSQSFIGSNVNISTSSWTTITSLSLSAGAWIVMGTATFVRGSGTSARTFSLQITDGSLTYASGSHGMGSVTGNAIQVSCNSIITLGATTTINLQGTTSTTSSPVDYASFIDAVMGVSCATGLIATRIG